ncbi:MAG: hypothetical protein AEth_01302 [Candidatus Argoarchaeum ethanivorans]|uniref:Type I restriction enzyme R protein N-terminal domain-containing protein n=1 Tax=Candidatus Argoarchaeum ethanivorans TaxID=2608793 RepID=A0A8B3S2V5_9EURY|nr:MAG: hypothetical protein AEth_01302 [Candidatus Argoarchaeum ethanivorans]
MWNLFWIKKYPKENIDIEVKVEGRVPDDRADIVVYDEDGHDYLIVECKRDGISDAEFKQALEQAFGNANSKRAKYAIVVAGTTRTANEAVLLIYLCTTKLCSA